jgi:maltose phosphorylase
MKNYIKHDPWCVIEEGFHPEFNEITESLCSLGNGRMGQRGNFEETFTGHTLQGNYVAGVYYPDKTRVGWWKNGYPEYFAKVLNAANWVGLKIVANGEELDLNVWQVLSFKRVLNMKEGFLQRTCHVKSPKGIELKIDSIRLNSMADDLAGAISYKIESVNFSGSLKIDAFIDGDIKNKDSNYDEKFWNYVSSTTANSEAIIVLETKKTLFHVATGQKVQVLANGVAQDFENGTSPKEKFVQNATSVTISEGQTIEIQKFAVNLSSENYPKEQLQNLAQQELARIAAKGFDILLSEQAAAWAAKWEINDVQIEGDIAAQQGIRFNIFQLNQTYTGEDDRLNIGPKGFTGEKYGGSTYWDTEAYCLPFYLSTAPQNVSRNLLVYRWKHLPRAIENAEKLGFTGGAALYPMVTMNGEECHNEWEITFEEIHRNGAIAHAIHDYIRYTGDKSYLAQYGLEVLIGIARFWVQRVHWSKDKNQYVMLGVTGPNEYENNINNNWYTNYIAKWCLNYCVSSAQWVQANSPEDFRRIAQRTNLKPVDEFAKMQEVAAKMYEPQDANLGIYLQQDGFLDKEDITIADLKETDRPLNQNWSWDRILRSPFIKQADVLQGLYLFEDDFDLETIRRNYNYYEPKTVHESSLSPCVHSILAAKLGMKEDSYRFYNRAARLDLDDYNNDTEDGLHITSMAGTWMSVIKGFGGLDIKNNELVLNPIIPNGWDSYSFRIGFRNAILKFSVNKLKISVQNISNCTISLVILNKNITLAAFETQEVDAN